MTTYERHQDRTEFGTAPADFVDGQGTPPTEVPAEHRDVQPPPPSEERLASAAGGTGEPVRTEESVRTDPALQSGGGHPSSTPARDSADALFAEHDLSDLRARWSDVQATFVDDPRDCVQKADGLVSDTVEQLTASFSTARSRLEEQWSRGEEASTEDLRQALKRYRDFFDRLLAV